MKSSEEKYRFDKSLDVLHTLRVDRGLTYKEIADILGVTRTAIYNAMKCGVLSVKMASRISEKFPEFKHGLMSAKKVEVTQHLMEKVNTRYDDIFDKDLKGYYILQFKVPISTREWLAHMSLNHGTSIAEAARRVLIKTQENHTANQAAVDSMADKWVEKNKDVITGMSPEYLAKVAYKAGFNRSKVK